jgi:hypothetical protein
MIADKQLKGFAGLNSTVSRVEAIEAPPEPPAFSVPEPEVQQQKIYQGKAKSRRSMSGAWWAIGIGLAILFVWIGKSGTGTTTRSPSYDASTPSGSTAPAYPPSPRTYASNEEQVPPFGSGMTLNQAQILYCLSQDVRLSAWQGAVNKYSENSVDAFNAAVNDYNARCSNSRYRNGTLESIRAEVEGNRRVLVSQGVAKASANR